jgi:catechol 2,3-dioxygenase-like lactoylglutathione lyase family enzyme
MPTRRVVDHLTIGVTDIDRSRAFHSAALAALGFTSQGAWSAQNRELTFGFQDRADFAISTEYQAGAPIHVAFAAESRAQVDAFHAAALSAGPSIRRGTTVRSYSIPTVTTSRPCTTRSLAAPG